MKFLISSFSTATACFPGTQPFQGGCRPCNPGYLSTDGSLCVQVPPGEVTGVKTGGSGSFTCDANFKPNAMNTFCEPCPPGKYGNGVECSACVSGKYLSPIGTSTPSTCITCPAGYYCNKTLPNICPSGTHAPEGSGSISDCKIRCSGNGYSLDIDSDCICDYGFSGPACSIKCSGRGNLVNSACVCQAGYDSSESSYCDICAVGAFGSDAENSFSDGSDFVPAKCFQCDDTNSTTVSTSSTHKGDCVCKSSYFMDNATASCKSCSDVKPNSTSQTGSTSEAGCFCAAGYYTADWSSTDSKNDCKKCGSSETSKSFSSERESDSSETTLCKCATGFTNNDGSDSSPHEGPGKQCEVQCSGNGEVKNSECVCKTGYATSTDSMISPAGIYCNICSPGSFFQDGMCNGCPVGTTTLDTYDGVNPSDSGECSICAPGFVKLTGASICTKCTLNSVANADKSACECKANYFLLDSGSCQNCGANSASVQGGLCSCVTGYVENSNGRCSSCADGYEKLLHSTECTLIVTDAVSLVSTMHHAASQGHTNNTSMKRATNVAVNRDTMSAVKTAVSQLKALQKKSHRLYQGLVPQ